MSLRRGLGLLALLGFTGLSGTAVAQTPLPRVPDATAIFDWAERAFPELFPGRQVNRALDGLIYRAYAPSGNYVGVLGGDVWILGPVAGSSTQPARVGMVADFACLVFPDSCVVAAQPTVDRCLRLSTGQYASAPALIPATGPFTVEFWVYDVAESNAFVEYLSQGSSNLPYFYFGTSANTRVLRIGNGFGESRFVMPQREWVHLAVSRAADGRGTLYVNGSSVATAGATAEDLSGSANGPFRIGSQFGERPNEFFNGCIDELKIWSRARTDEQVRLDMQRGVVDAAGLVAYYDFNTGVEPARLWPASGRPGPVLAMEQTADLLPVSDVAGIASVTKYPFAGLSNCTGQCGPHFTAQVAAPTQSKGMSWYSTVWPIVREATDGFQLGLGSTWINPDLRALEIAKSPLIMRLCADSPFAPDDLGGWGYGRWILSQSNEGGLGYWESLSFRSAMPKWRAGATANCYRRWANTPGWGYDSTQVLASADTGLVQLSNRILMPPDGMTFPLTTNGEVLGQAWMALPWPAVSPTPAAPTGSNAWTIFFNAANFKGPVAYYMPQFWSQPAQKDPQLAGLGLDTAPAFIGSMASEWGAVPLQEGRDGSGTLYGRIPETQFPVDANGRTVISQDSYSWNEQAIAVPFADWLAGRRARVDVFPAASGTRLTLFVDSQPALFQRGDAIKGMSDIVQVQTFDGGQSWGFKWAAGSAGAGGSAAFPSYFRQVGSTREIVARDSVPVATGLRSSSFGYKGVTPTAYTPPVPDWWNSSDPALRGGYATLSDGSLVEYRWYRFVDQPALQRLNLTASEKQLLQSLVEKMHRTWTTNADYLPPPSSGRLVSFDPGLLTTPPPGLEAGYVPIVVSQTGSRLGPPLPAAVTAANGAAAATSPVRSTRAR